MHNVVEVTARVPAITEQARKSNVQNVSDADAMLPPCTDYIGMTCQCYSVDIVSAIATCMTHM